MWLPVYLLTFLLPFELDKVEVVKICAKYHKTEFVIHRIIDKSEIFRYVDMDPYTKVNDLK